MGIRRPACSTKRSNRIWLASFMDCDLGYIDLEETCSPYTTLLAQKCKLCLRNVL